MNITKQGIWKLLPNRVRRNYLGGAGIDLLHGMEDVAADSDRPEEWIGSLVEAVNPGMEPIVNEGLAWVSVNGVKHLLRDLINEDPVYYLGEKQKNAGMGFLFKILDSAMRLHVQVHPTSEFAREKMGKPYGKLECYYILKVREGIQPYIRLGFQHAPEKDEWRSIIEQQDIKRMDACFEKIPVQVGEIWYIPGGMPHAIGEGITMLEIMEPSDLVVRCEFNREGVVVPPEARFMGLGLDFCLDIFDYQAYSPEQIRSRCCVTPEVLSRDSSCEVRRLIGREQTTAFEVMEYRLSETLDFNSEGKAWLGVVCEGKMSVTTANVNLHLEPGDTFFAAAGMEICQFVNLGETPNRFCMVSSGNA